MLAEQVMSKLVSRLGKLCFKLIALKMVDDIVERKLSAEFRHDISRGKWRTSVIEASSTDLYNRP